MEFSILGPLEVRSEGHHALLKAAKERELLSLLLATPNRVVSSDRLIDQLWEDDPPDSAPTGLRVLISRLRKTLASVEPGERVVTRSSGYQLVVRAGELDAAHFDALVSRARTCSQSGAPEEAARLLREAGGLWRGPALAEVAERPFARAEAVRLEQARLGALEDLAEAELAAGRHQSLVAELEALTVSHPERERLWAARMIALYRSGRQGEALQVYQDLRGHLGEELGLEPSPALVTLETAVLRQDPALAWQAPQPMAAGILPRGVVTFLLTDIVGSTTLWEEHRHVMGDVLARHDELLRSIVATHDGTLLQSRGEGDSTFSVFARATDAAEAALEAQDALTVERWPSNLVLRVRMAIHAGETHERDGGYHGSTVNRAARLRSVADGGQILLSGSTADVVIDHLEGVSWVELGERQLRGLARRERVVALQRRAPELAAGAETHGDALAIPLPRPLARVATGVFVGREPELAQLHALWEQACHGKPHLALLSGEPGIGKTRLTAELAHQVHAEGALVLFGRCDEDAGEPYQPFAEAIRGYLRALPPDIAARRLGATTPDLSRLVPDLTPQQGQPANAGIGDAEAERRALFDAVSAQLAALASTTPVLLVLDDVHWAARPTLLMLRHLLRSDEMGRVLVVATYRDTDVDRSHPLVGVLADLRRELEVTRISLSGLDAHGVVNYLEATTGQSLEDGERRLAQTVHAETEGNPFFLVELLRHLVETGAVYRTDGRWHADFDKVSETGLPEGVRDVVTRRLGRLSEAANRVLAAAAVIGLEFTLSVLDGVPDTGSADDKLLDVLEETVRAGLVAETAAGRYAFSHSLIRQTLYEELSSTRRARLHRRVGEAIEALPDAASQVEALAHHFAEAALDGQVAKAADYALAAGRHALERLAHEQAITYLERGLEALDFDAPAHDRRADLCYTLAVAKWSAGDRAGARATAHQAAEAAKAAGDGVRLAKIAVLAIGTIEYMTEDRPTARLCEDAIELLGDSEPTLRARLLAGLGRYRAQCEGRGPEGEALAREGVAIARETGAAATLASTLNAHFLTLQGLGRPDLQLALATEMVELARPIADRRMLAEALQARCTAHLAVADLAGFDSDVTELETLGSQWQWWRPLAVAAALRAGLAVAQGRFSEAAALEAEALDRAGGDADIVALTLVPKLSRQVLQGDYQRAAEGATWLYEHYPSLGPHLAPTLAWTQAAGGHLDAARAHVEDLVHDGTVELREDSMRPAILDVLAYVFTLIGDPTPARVLYQEMLPFRGQVMLVANASLCHGAADRFLGMLAAVDQRWTDAEGHFRDALDLETRLAAPPLLVETRCWYARMLHDRDGPGDRTRAVELIAQARASARELGVKLGAADSLPPEDRQPSSDRGKKPQTEAAGP